MNPRKRDWEYSQKHDKWTVECEIHQGTVGAEIQKPCSTFGSSKSRQNANEKNHLERDSKCSPKHVSWTGESKIDQGTVGAENQRPCSTLGLQSRARIQGGTILIESKELAGTVVRCGFLLLGLWGDKGSPCSPSFLKGVSSLFGLTDIFTWKYQKVNINVAVIAKIREKGAEVKMPFKRPWEWIWVNNFNISFGNLGCGLGGLPCLAEERQAESRLKCSRVDT